MNYKFPVKLKVSYHLCLFIIVFGGVWSLIKAEYSSFLFLSIILVDLVVLKKHFKIFENVGGHFNDKGFKAQVSDFESKLDYFKFMVKQFQIHVIILAVGSAAVGTYVCMAIYLNPSYGLHSTQLPLFTILISFYYLFIAYINHKRLTQFYGSIQFQ